MTDTVRFETPENIAVTYRLAGAGTRFIAFFFDTLLIFFGFVTVGLVATITLLLTSPTSDLAPYVAALIFLIGFGFANIAYYGLFEWFTRGHTPGKRLMGIRVVMDEGFSLTFTGVVIRNIFRVLDIIPILWIVPVVTRKTQRFGDMVAGTIVVSEQPVPGAALREAMAARRPEEIQFTFTGEQLGRLRDEDVRALEMFLERRPRLHPEHRALVAQRLVRGLGTRLELPIMPTDQERERFLEDLLAAFARREARELG